jgi:hypothetical protein
MRPPILTGWLAGQVLPEEAAGDLAEEFVLMASGTRPGRARRWYRWQVIRSAVTPHPGTLTATAGGILLPLLVLDRLWAAIYSQIPLRDGLGREPWMLGVNIVVAALLARRIPARALPFAWLAAALSVLLSVAETGPVYFVALILALSLSIASNQRSTRKPSCE